VTMSVEEGVVGDDVWGEAETLHGGEHGESAGEGALEQWVWTRRLEVQRNEGAEGVQRDLW
jgi:hypothetical protein